MSTANSPRIDEFFDYDAASNEPTNSLQATGIDRTETGTTGAGQEQRSLGVSRDRNPGVDLSTPGPAVPSNSLTGPASLSRAATDSNLSHRPYSDKRSRSKRSRVVERHSNQEAPTDRRSNVGKSPKARKRPLSTRRASRTRNTQDSFVNIAPAEASSSQTTARAAESSQGPISFDFSSRTKTSDLSEKVSVGRTGKPLKHWIAKFDEVGNLLYHIAEGGQTLEAKLEMISSRLQESIKVNQPPEISLAIITAVLKDIAKLIGDVNKRRSHPALDKAGDQLCLRLNEALRNLVSNLGTLASTTGRTLTQTFDHWLSEFRDSTEPYIERQIQKFDEMMAGRETPKARNPRGSQRIVI